MMQVQSVNNNQLNFKQYYKLPNPNDTMHKVRDQVADLGCPNRFLPDYFPDVHDCIKEIKSKPCFNKQVLIFYGQHPFSRNIFLGISNELLSIYRGDKIPNKMSLRDLVDSRKKELDSLGIDLPKYDSSIAYIVTGDESMELLEKYRDNEIIINELNRQNEQNKLLTLRELIQKTVEWFKKTPEVEKSFTSEPQYLQHIKYLINCNEKLQQVFDDLIKDKTVIAVDSASDIMQEIKP